MIVQRLKIRKKLNIINKVTLCLGSISLKKGSLLLLGFVLAGGNLCFAAQESRSLTGKEIITRSDEMMQGKTQAAIADITIKSRRWTRTMETRSYTIRAQRKSFFEILSPKKDAGNRFLLLDQLMWHYVPKLGQTIKISPSMMLQSWMGSDFSNDDIVKESSIINDYTHTLTDTKFQNGQDNYRVELIPDPDAAVVWGKIIYYARTSDLLPSRVEFYNEHGGMKKIMTYSNYRFMHDRIIPATMRMVTVGKKDRYTEMTIKKIKFDLPMPEKLFTLQYLKQK